MLDVRRELSSESSQETLASMRSIERGANLVVVYGVFVTRWVMRWRNLMPGHGESVAWLPDYPVLRV